MAETNGLSVPAGRDSVPKERTKPSYWETGIADSPQDSAFSKSDPEESGGLVSEESRPLRQMGYYVYILYSKQFHRTYTGQTNNLQNRLSYHNSGKVRSTKAYVPWELIYFEEHNSRAEAMKREKWFKFSPGRKLIKSIVEEYLLKEDNG